MPLAVPTDRAARRAVADRLQRGRVVRGDTPGAQVTAWLVIVYGVGTAVLVALGWLFEDATWWLFGANLVAFHLLAPAVLVVPVVLVLRWWVPAVACTVAAVVWLVTFGPLFVGQAVAGDASLRVASFNMRPTRDVDHVVRLVDRTAPDVLLLQEVLPGAQDDLRTQLRSLPHRHFAAVEPGAPGGGGVAVLSRLPIADIEPVAGLPEGARPTDVVTLDTAGGPVAVVSVHLASPCLPCLRPDNFGARIESEARQRTREAETIAGALPDGPAIVGGDLNSATRNAPRRRLLDAGLRDLHRAVGSGPGFTSIRSHGVIRIDWLFASDAFVPVREWVGPRDGSDHRPVIADVDFAAPVR